MININRKEYSTEKIDCMDWANIMLQDRKSIMLRSLELSKTELIAIPSLKNCHLADAKKFEDDPMSEHVINQLSIPGKIALDAGIGYYFLKNQDVIPHEWAGKTIHFPGTIFSHKPYGRFWEPHVMLQLYQHKNQDQTVVWWHTYVNLHVLHSNDIFAYLPEEARHQSDIITKSFIDDEDPNKKRF